MVAEALAKNGYVVFPFDPDLAVWAKAAAARAERVLAEATEFRHGGTWFVGVDALPNMPDGSIDGVPLAGAWRGHVAMPDQWHRAQLSVVFPGYPRQDADESDAAHRFRRQRDAAHVDGLLPEGPLRRRHLREPHSFILGLPLNEAEASPLVVYPESHRIIGRAFAQAFDGVPVEDWGDVDITDVYQSARREVFATCARVEVAAKPGQATLLHRHLLHGVAPWDPLCEAQQRMVAYFRPIGSFAQWL